MESLGIVVFDVIILIKIRYLYFLLKLGFRKLIKKDKIKIEYVVILRKKYFEVNSFYNYVVIRIVF